MKILIIYATKTNTVSDCIELLKKYLPNTEFALCNIKDKDIPKLSDFDFIIIGSPVRMNKFDKKILSFMKSQKKVLLQNKVAYFVCCAFPDCFGNYVNKNIPQDLRQNAIEIGCFGGRLDIERQRGIDKLITKMVRADILGGGNNGEARRDESLPTVLENNISQFAEIIRGQIKK